METGEQLPGLHPPARSMSSRSTRAWWSTRTARSA